MRVIAGIAHGTKLASLPGEEITRPTVDRVKEAMFSSVQFLLQDARVLDLFGGSGQLGIEAVSRGAASCVFVDQNSDAIRVIEANCRAAGLAEKCEIRQTTAEIFLRTYSANFHLAFLDPPYRHDTLAKILPILSDKMAVGGVVLCESELTAELPQQAAELKQKKQYRYGKILVTRYEKEECAV